MSFYAFSAGPSGMAGLYHFGGGGLGALGALVPASGPNGAALLYDDVIRNGWQADEVRWRYVSGNLPNLFVDEDSSVYHPPLPDGQYQAFGIVSLNGVDLPGLTTLNLQVGAVSTITQPFMAWLDWVPYLTSDLPDCPVFTIADAVQRAATRFYRETRAWRAESVEVATTVAGQELYLAENMPAYTELAGLPAMWVGDREVDEARSSQTERTEPGRRSDCWTIEVAGPDIVRLSPAPRTAGQLIRGTVAYMPGPQATGIPWALYRLHREPIESLARSLLMEQKSKPWSDAAMAAKHMRDYQRWSLRAATEAGPMSRRPRLRVQPSPF